MAGDDTLRTAAQEALTNLDAFFNEGEGEELDYADRAREVLRAALGG